MNRWHCRSSSSSFFSNRNKSLSLSKIVHIFFCYINKLKCVNLSCIVYCEYFFRIASIIALTSIVFLFTLSRNAMVQQKQTYINIYRQTKFAFNSFEHFKMRPTIRYSIVLISLVCLSIRYTLTLPNRNDCACFLLLINMFDFHTFIFNNVQIFFKPKI